MPTVLILLQINRILFYSKRNLRNNLRKEKFLMAKEEAIVQQENIKVLESDVDAVRKLPDEQ